MGYWLIWTKRSGNDNEVDYLFQIDVKYFINFLFVKLIFT